MRRVALMASGFSLFAASYAVVSLAQPGPAVVRSAAPPTESHEAPPLLGPSRDPASPAADAPREDGILREPRVGVAAAWRLVPRPVDDGREPAPAPRAALPTHVFPIREAVREGDRARAAELYDAMVRSTDDLATLQAARAAVVRPIDLQDPWAGGGGGAPASRPTLANPFRGRARPLDPL